jgi:hypothetical protein
LLAHFVELIAGVGGELARLLGILERGRSPDQRRGDDVGDQRVLRNGLEALGRGGERAVRFVLLLVFLLFLLVLAHALPLSRLRKTSELIPIFVTRL